MNRPLPECMPCVLNFKDPVEQVKYMFLVKAMMELGFTLDTDNNIYTRLVDEKTMAYLTTIYSRDEIYAYVKDCVDKGFKVASGPKAPSVNDIEEYQRRLMNNENVSFKETMDHEHGIGLYLENYLDIIHQRQQVPEYEEEVGIRKGR